MKGFCVHGFLGLQPVYRTVAIDRGVPLEHQEACPCCAVRLVASAALTGSDGGLLRVGECPECGYVGYMDRPSEAWLERFYRTEWDGAPLRDIAREARVRPVRMAGTKGVVLSRIADLVPDRTRLVCDVGCGKGEALAALDRMGFRNVLGIESSAYRSALVRARYGFQVLTGNMESDRIIAALGAMRPVGAFFMHHVLEHIARPEAALAAMAALQDEGDYLAIAVPNAASEPLANILFWLMHLHAFTPEGLERLCMRHGYEVVDSSATTAAEIVFIARKAALPYAARNHHGPKEAGRDGLAERIASYVTLPDPDRGRRYIFSWMKAYRPETGATTHASAVFPLASLAGLAELWYPLKRIKRLARRLAGRPVWAKERSMVVSALKSRRPASASAPVEIQFERSVELIVK